ncbi:molybdopterin-synthase adenylyltransferase MoeB [Gallibacterium anatis]|uniref:Molybdopterin-synthase adenylyltransferase n=2 Tax=Gallibacterium anatis TaxID=750 RepID=A0A1A7P5A6_9PAST|nr:molybdopterin-synthase adenylyltransferase MoeB [Gallibacterium anatis]KGQ56621.1 molybdopterin-synthase adenylyltransferase [Gallibacterium anatis DSM 16844 = F 149]KGQ57140.1 molybdopterin-synthase adenylyltransferase [Gallibacterium anatis str. Avicor]KGQ63304.1 molybdopterin-synthase adenylyltransferase [Gallibacterium anatis 4895]OBW96599.1 molybdopterin-synthase adenylyltransferase [Gallibacterium anatis]OBW97637.1 molybdopterin-synthase adenylyltransferase [Gallibacterium anatis]
MKIELTDHEMLRYNRQIVMKAIDFDGQEKLKAGKMLIVGLGGLGCAAAQYLAAAGVGELTLLDFDKVSLSNLQRQVLHTDQRIDMPKVESAKMALSQINPLIKINTINQKMTSQQLEQLIATVDVVLDCTDNVESRNQLDLICQQLQKPLVSGAAIRMEGQITVFTYQPGTPSYRNLSQLFGENVLSCVEAGVLSPIVGIVGSIQALEAIKVLLNIGDILCGRLLMIDGMSMQFRELKLPVS